jgi:hypothetical protein
MRLAGFCCTLFENRILLASLQKRAQPVAARSIDPPGRRSKLYKKPNLIKNQTL